MCSIISWEGLERTRSRSKGEQGDGSMVASRRGRQCYEEVSPLSF